MDAGAKSGDAAGRDTHFLVPPEMRASEKRAHMGHPARAGVDAQRAELPDLTVGRMDMIAAPLLILGRKEHRNKIRFPAGGFCQKLFSGRELLELCLGVVKLDHAFLSVNPVIQRDKPCQPFASVWLDDQMGYCPAAAVNDYRFHVAVELVIGSASFAPDHECYLSHNAPS